jgi:hypothetical protein
MGKTGSNEWVKVKGRMGKTRLVPKSEGSVKRPGPGQRYDSSGHIRRRLPRSEKSVIGPK